MNSKITRSILLLFIESKSRIYLSKHFGACRAHTATQPDPGKAGFDCSLGTFQSLEGELDLCMSRNMEANAEETP
jgi:hypothetical protein